MHNRLSLQGGYGLKLDCNLRIKSAIDCTPIILQSHKLSDCQLFENFDFSLSTWMAEENRPEGYGSKVYGLLSKYASQNKVIFGSRPNRHF